MISPTSDKRNSLVKKSVTNNLINIIVDKKNRKILIYSSLIIMLFIIALISDKIVPYDPIKADLTTVLLSPSNTHIFGTDNLGRDLFSRVLVGGRSSIFSTLALILIISIVGTIVGLYCGVYGGIRDIILMRIADMFLAFPGMVFAIAVAAVLIAALRKSMKENFA